MENKDILGVSMSKIPPPPNTTHPSGGGQELPDSYDDGGFGYFRLRPDTPPEIKDLLDLIPDPNSRGRMFSKLVQMALSSYPRLGLLLGESQPFMDALFKEIIPMHTVPPSAITTELANQVGDALQLLRVVVISYPSPGMSYHMECFPRYLIPLLSIKCENGPVDLVLVRTLEVFEAILMARDDRAKHEVYWPVVVPSCLDVMLTGNEESKISASALLEGILRNDEPLLKTAKGGQLQYRSVSLTDVVSVLEKMFTYECYLLVKSSFSCCLYLSEYVEARHTLVRRLPYLLRKGYLLAYLVHHPGGSLTRSNLDMLIKKVSPYYKYISAAERAKMKEITADVSRKRVKRSIA